MSPILVRPVREQLEHDRLIRHLQGRYKRRHEVAINVGDEQVAPVKVASQTLYPDLVLTDDTKLAGVVEVETGESVNNLEAMAQWVHFARARVPFHLYVPVLNYDAARRLCEAHQAQVAEIWTYRPGMEGFDLVRMHQDPTAGAAPRASAKAGTPRAAGPAAKPRARAAAPKPVKTTKPVKAAKAAKSTKSKPAARSAGKAKAAAPKSASKSKAAKSTRTAKTSSTKARGSKKR